MRLVALIIALLCLPFAAHAQESPKISWQVVLESQPAPGGTVAVALVGKPQPGWHGYWINPGEAGTATRVTWKLPTGFSISTLAYPTPHLIVTSGIVNYAYEDEFALIGKLSTPRSAGAASTLTADIEYLACSDSMCVPEKARVSTAITPGEGRPNGADRARFSSWRARIPSRTTSEARYTVSEGKMHIAITAPGRAQGARFFPATPNIIDPTAPQTAVRQGNEIVISVKQSAPTTAPVSGVVTFANGRGYEVRAMRSDAAAHPLPPQEVAGATDVGVAREGVLPVAAQQPVEGMLPAIAPGETTPAEQQIDATQGDVLSVTPGLGTAMLAFLGAVLGGLILNAMPCVFPILSLKVVSLAKSGGNERQARREALAYAAGSTITCTLLGLAIIVLRATGHEAGWAFQLQDPRTIAILMVVTGAIALNLAGLYEMSLPVRIRNNGGAFSTGALAAFVATPCTGPFMGAALGAAMVLPAAAALLVFAGLGLGIALPFLLIGFVPALRRRMPRPGSWMVTLRRIMAVPMLLTTLALAWLLGRQAGSDGAVLGMAAAMAFGIALWLGGQRQAGGRRAWPWTLPGAAVAGAIALSVQPVALTMPEALAGQAQQPFTQARLTELTREGRPVFLYFTADWCVTCKVNERTTLADTRVRDALRRGGVNVLVGDWTNGDPEMGRFIMAHGRAGVPLYLWYPAGRSTPETLPQILTASMLLERVGTVTRT